MHQTKLLILFILLLPALHCFSQEVNLDSLLDSEMSKKNQSETQHTEATFKSGRLINGHTVETTQERVLDIKISHRFGTLNEGFNHMFGLDNAMVRLGAEYGFTNRFSVGGGRSTFEKQYDGFLKYRLLWQSSGKHNMPVSLTLLSSVMLKTLKNPIDSAHGNSVDRYYFAHQVLLARKFSSNFSLQLAPTVIHYNNIPFAGVPNNLYSIGAAARLKLSSHSAITAEYYYQFPNYKLPGTYNSLSLGYEIETGGHVFSIAS